MSKNIYILVSGIALLQCGVCIAGSDSDLFDEVTAASEPSTNRLVMPAALPVLATQTTAPASQPPAGAGKKADQSFMPAPLPVLSSQTKASRSPATTAPASQTSDSDGETESPPAGGVMASLDDEYKLGPGDTVVYQVVEDEDAPTNLVITDSGDLEVPYYGLVHAAGETCSELANEVKAQLQQKLYYRATVVLALAVANKNWVTGKMYVSGQVKNPGSYPIPSTEDMTVSKAILAAGGFSDFSDKKRVRLIHKTTEGEQTYDVNVVKVWAGETSLDKPVQPGDMVVVPARLVNY